MARKFTEQTLLYPRSKATQQKFVAAVTAIQEGCLLVDVKNKFELGDELELMTPAGNHTFVLTTLFNQQRHPSDVAPGSGHVRRIPMDTHGLESLVEDLSEAQFQFCLIMKAVDEAPSVQRTIPESVS